MNDRSSPVLATLVRVAVGATGASRGRLILAGAGSGAGGGPPQVLATHGAGDGWREVDEAGISSYVIATGQPQVLTLKAPVAGSALCVPCPCDDEVIGALELEDERRDGPFSIDDMELAGLLGGIAGVAMARRQPMTVPDPGRLVGDLDRLASADWARYAVIARLVRSVLDA